MARSRFSSQNVQHTPAPDHFLKLGCGKIAARSPLSSQNVKNCTPSDYFGSSDVEKWHETVAQSRFPSKNVKNMKGSGRFLTFGCGKMARCCGTKEGTFLEVPMSKGVRQKRWID